jgi:essential nuclear protein 1
MAGGKTRPQKRGPVSLADQLHSDQYVTRQRSRATRRAADGEDESAPVGLDARTARRIAKASRAQLQDSDDSDNEAVANEDDDGMPAPSSLPGENNYDGHNPQHDFFGNNTADGAAADDDVDIEYDDHESVMTEQEEFGDLGNAYGITDEEAAEFDRFMPQSTVRTRTLADIIMEKIHEKQAKAAGEVVDEDGASDAGTTAGPKIDGRVKRVYEAIGTILKSYTSGKIPKAFKVLPHVQNWEQLLFLTKPQAWSPHAAYAATRIFAAGLNERMAQRYYSAILLPIVHFHMEENKRLHPALFMALRKALFKPAAFYKGFLLPLCNEGDCTLREALAVGAVLQKMHLPPLPTAVTIVKISQLPYTPANGLFLRVLVDKKMGLPYQAVDALVKYFHGFVHSHSSRGEGEALPVLWHQTLLSFTQHYKMDLTPEQLELLRQVCTKHFHYMITPEIRREIAAAQGKASSMH